MNKKVQENLKTFFSFPAVQQAVQEDDFDYVFKHWLKYIVEGAYLYLGSYDLASFLEECGIDWIKLVTRIPDYAFWYYPETTLTIPTNIKSIGALPFLSSSIKDINYEGTKEDFSKIKLKGEKTLTGGDHHTIKVHCSDGDYVRRFQL